MITFEYLYVYFEKSHVQNLRSKISRLEKSLTCCGFVQVQMQVETHFVSDVLRGNDTTEMKITLLRYIDDEMPPDDE